MQYVTIKILMSEYEAVRSQLTEVEHKEVSFKDDFFKGDVKHDALKSASIKAYKQLKEYEFNKRNKL